MPTLSLRGISLFVDIIGQGPPVLLMHGGPGADHTTLRAFRALADHFRLIFYDHRCNGRSTGADVSTLTWENLTADVEALRNMLDIEQWAVIGHSFGGMVALEYALRYPGSLSHLVLLDTGGDMWWAQENAPRLLAKRGFPAEKVETARRFLNGDFAPEEMLPSLMKLGDAYNYHTRLFGLLRELLAGPLPKLRPEALIYASGHLLRGWNVMQRLDEIRVPTLVLAGRHDFQFPPEHQGMLAAGIPGARLEIVENAGHNAHSEQPDEVLPRVRRFLTTRTANSTSEQPNK